jgi:hypothetical protein
MNNSVEGKDSSKESHNNSQESVEQELLNLELEKYVFHLYVAGNSPKSIRAIQNLQKYAKNIFKGVMNLK